jgi:hypothetical protein
MSITILVMINPSGLPLRLPAQAHTSLETRPSFRLIPRWTRLRGAQATPGSIIPSMQVTTGTVVGGMVVVEGVPLVEGSVVTVLSRQPDEPFALSAQDEDDLLAAIAEIERGEFVTPEVLLESLRQYG